MPIFEFVCSQNHKTEQLFMTTDADSDVNVITCPVCLGQQRRRQAHRVISAPAVQFKGEGWTPVFHGSRESQVAGVPVHKGDDPNEIAKKVVKSHGAKALTKAVMGAK